MLQDIKKRGRGTPHHQTREQKTQEMTLKLDVPGILGPGSVSVILPVFRGANFIQQSLEALLAWLRCCSRPFEVLVVNDGSDDNTGQRVREAQALGHSGVRLLENLHNQGKGAAVRQGMLAAQGEYRVFLDCDMPFDLEALSRIIGTLEAGADLAIGCRVHPESLYIIRPNMFALFTTRHWLSRLANRVIRLCVPGLSDTQAGLKGFRREAAQYIFHRQRLNRFSFDVEILRIAQVARLRIVDVPVQYRYTSESSTVEFVKDSLWMLRDLVRIKVWEAQGQWEKPQAVKSETEFLSF